VLLHIVIACNVTHRHQPGIDNPIAEIADEQDTEGQTLSEIHMYTQ